MNLELLDEMILSDKIKFIYKNQNLQDLKENLKRDIIKNFKKQYSSKNRIQIITKQQKTYIFDGMVLEDVINKKSLSNEEIVKNLIKKRIRIYPTIINKFYEIGENKILEIIEKFVNGCYIIYRNATNVIVKNNLFDLLLKFDYHNNILIDIITNKYEEIEDNQISIALDKFIINKDNKNNNNFLEKIEFLNSYLYDINEFKDDIINNFISYKNLTNNSILVNSKNYIYTIKDYNIISIKNNKEILPTKFIEKKTNKDILSKLNISMNKEYYCDISIEQYYGNYMKANEYCEKMGISIKVLIKFRLDNNANELFRFLTKDICLYGQVIYDNYLENFIVVSTNRFIYVIKEGVLLNIYSIEGEEIEECSYNFPNLQKAIIRKNDILDLDINDKVRNYISYKDILNLNICDHVRIRYEERISKTKQLDDELQCLKNDIYKNGKVILGTYYLSTKLVQTKKYVYVINKNEIISIWKINKFINEIHDRYFNEVLVLNKKEEVIL